MSGEQNRRNFQIEPFKHSVVIKPDYAERTLKIIQHAIDQIYNRKAEKLSFEQLYRHCYLMVLHGFEKKLYSGLVSTLMSNLNRMARFIEIFNEDLILEKLIANWNHHIESLETISKIVVYMEITFMASFKNSVHRLGRHLWTTVVFRTSYKIQQRLTNKLLEMILRERTGEVINKGLMRNIFEMLLELDSSIYKYAFEKPFLEASSEFYIAESREFIETSSCGEYLTKAETRLYEEIERVDHYNLDIDTEEAITEIVEKKMLTDHMLTLIHMENSGLVNMLVDHKLEDLKRMYSLFTRITDGLFTIREVFTSHVKDTGKEFVTNRENCKKPAEFVAAILEMKDKYDEIIRLSFYNEKSFRKALDSSFKYFINLNDRCPEYISLFVDGKLRQGVKGVKEEEEIILDKMIVLFRYLEDKDVFVKYYKRHLSKRLLSGKTVSDDAERSLIVKLRYECGFGYTSQLECMLKDMKISHDRTREFYEICGPELTNQPTLAVKILTTGIWPEKVEAYCRFPVELLSLCEKFRLFYLANHSGRKLTWQTNLGTADLRATFGNGQKYEIEVSTYQMSILMMFNISDTLSYNQLMHSTEIDPPDLKRCLQSLACAKGKNVLKKEPMSRDIGEKDVFSVNDDFSSKHRKVKIGTVVAQKVSEIENERTRKIVVANRKPQIESAIVRIMKARKEMKHNDMISEVVEQLKSRFVPDITEIKKRIESLIEREYLERDESDRSVYRYLA